LTLGGYVFGSGSGSWTLYNSMDNGAKLTVGVFQSLGNGNTLNVRGYGVHGFRRKQSRMERQEARKV
jgi:hypothetical protein